MPHKEKEKDTGEELQATTAPHMGRNGKKKERKMRILVMLNGPVAWRQTRRKRTKGKIEKEKLGEEK